MYIYFMCIYMIKMEDYKINYYKVYQTTILTRIPPRERRVVSAGMDR